MFGIIALSLLMLASFSDAKNPITPNKRVNDPNIHII